MNKKIYFTSILTSVCITGIGFWLYFTSKYDKQIKDSEKLKSELSQNADSLDYYKKYSQAVHLFLEGNEVEANNVFNSIAIPDSLLLNTITLLQSKTGEQKPTIIINQKDKPVYDTVVTVDKSVVNDLEKAKNELAITKQKLSELQMANGILNLTSSKGKKFQYIGQTKNGNAEGFGVGIFETGSIYKGYWKNNLRNGKGIFTWKDEEHYEGEFLEDKRNGYGEYHWKNGEVYKGMWKNDKRHGEGKLYKKNGKLKKEGNWENDELAG